MPADVPAVLSPEELARLAETHEKGYRSTSDEVRGSNPICLGCEHAWPCDTARGLASAIHYAQSAELAYKALGIANRSVDRLVVERDAAVARAEEAEARRETLRTALQEIVDEGGEWSSYTKADLAAVAKAALDG